MPPGGTNPEKQSAAWPEARQGEIRTASLSLLPRLTEQTRTASSGSNFPKEDKASSAPATRQAKENAGWPLRKGFCVSPNGKHNPERYFRVASDHMSVQCALLAKRRIFLHEIIFLSGLAAGILCLGNLCSLSWENNAFWGKELFGPCP